LEFDSIEPAFSFTNAGSKQLLGGLNVWAYCQSTGYPTVGYKRGFIEGPQAAYNNWVCQTGEDQFNPTDPHPINMTKACQWQYDRTAVQAHPDDPDHAWSWKCYASDSGKPSKQAMVTWDLEGREEYSLDEDHSFAIAKCEEGTLTVNGHLQNAGGPFDLPLRGLQIELDVDHATIHTGPTVGLNLNKQGNGNFKATIDGLSPGTHEVAVWINAPATFWINEAANQGDVRAGIPFTCT
jgi:hypothetical protein